MKETQATAVLQSKLLKLMAEPVYTPLLNENSRPFGFRFVECNFEETPPEMVDYRINSVARGAAGGDGYTIEADNTGLTPEKIDKAFRMLVAAGIDPDLVNFNLIVSAEGYAALRLLDDFIDQGDPFIRRDPRRDPPMSGCRSFVGSYRRFSVYLVHGIGRDLEGNRRNQLSAVAVAGKPLLFLYNNTGYGVMSMAKNAIVIIDHV